MIKESCVILGSKALPEQVLFVLVFTNKSTAWFHYVTIYYLELI